MALALQSVPNTMFDSFVSVIVAAADLASAQQLNDLFTWRTHRQPIDPVVRHPFIDVRLVEYLLSIPAKPWCVNKHILRRAMKDRLPRAVLDRPKTPLGGDPALQLTRRAGVRWLDNFEVTPQLTRFVNLSQRRSQAEETPNELWANLRVFALNHWLAHSLPNDRRMVA